MTEHQRAEAKRNHRLVVVRCLAPTLLVGILAMSVLVTPVRVRAVECRTTSTLSLVPDIFSSIDTVDNQNGTFSLMLTLNGSRHVWFPGFSTAECSSEDELQYLPGSSHNVCANPTITYTGPFGGVGVITFSVCLADTNDVVVAFRAKYQEDLVIDRVFRARKKTGSVSYEVIVGQSGLPELQLERDSFSMREVAD